MTMIQHRRNKAKAVAVSAAGYRAGYAQWITVAAISLSLALLLLGAGRLIGP